MTGLARSRFTPSLPASFVMFAHGSLLAVESATWGRVDLRGDLPAAELLLCRWAHTLTRVEAIIRRARGAN